MNGPHSDRPPTVASTPPFPTGAPPRGASVGRYVLIELIGQGGMGFVYAAYDSKLDRKVAIKLLRPDLSEGGYAAEVESRLLREAQALARLNHPNVIAVHDVGTCEYGVFLAMEFAEGETLKRWLRTKRPLRERLSVVVQAGRGLAAAHEAGLVHRDFKPDNVVVNKRGEVVVLDFGLARVASDLTPEVRLPVPRSVVEEEVTGRSGDPMSEPLTRASQFLGTVGYMAPEQVFDGVSNAAADQFSFAVTLYVALYGERPFPANDLSTYLEQVFVPPNEPKGGNDVPSWLREIVLRGMAQEPSKRYPSMGAMLDELARDPSLVRRRVAGVAAGIAVLALALFGVVSLGKHRELVCAANPAELRGVWDDATRGAMMSAFEASAGAAGRTSAERIAEKLDVFRKEWLAMRADACRATHVTREQPEDVLRLRNDCLDRQRMSVRSLTGLLTHEDHQLVAKSLEIAYGLPHVSWCADVVTLRASGGLPDDPEKRPKALEVRAKLAEASAKELTGKLKEASTVAEEAVALARLSHFDATLAEALLAYGKLENRQGDWAASVPLLREAVFLAAGVGADSIVVLAAGALAFATGPKLLHDDAARIWLDMARAALRHQGGGDELELDVMHNEATLLEELEGHPEQAAPIWEKIVASSKRLYGASPATDRALYNLGNVYSDLGEPEKARPYLEEAATMAETIGGPSYMVRGAALQMLGQVLIELGEAQSAKAHLEDAIAIFKENGMEYWRSLAVERLAALALARGDLKLAEENGAEALLALRAAKSPGTLLPVVDVTVGLIRARTRPAEALALCEEALAEQEKTKAIEKDKTYGWDALRCKAEALIAQKRSEEAIPLLERSLTLSHRTFRGDYARVEFSLARALDAAHRDPKRVMELAGAAQRDFAAHPALAFELGEVAAFMAAHSNGG